MSPAPSKSQNEGSDAIALTVVRLVRDARQLVVLTGAGMSAESGIPTFRGSDASWWSRFDPQRLASVPGWKADRALVWAWYRWRIALIAQAQPNPGHRALAQLARRQSLVLVTQNVDDLHERAGSDVLAHLHGRIDALRCFACGTPYTRELPVIDLHAPDPTLEPPACPHCGDAVRPGVVWFGEILPELPWRASVEAVEQADVVLVVGTSGLVYPAAELPQIARRNGATVVEINPQPSALTAQVDLHWRATAAQALPRLLD